MGLLLLISLIAAAQSLCAAIDNDSDRLRCYDNENGRIQRTEPSVLADWREREEPSLHEWFSITPHQPNYILSVSYDANSDFSAYGDGGRLFSDVVAKFQINLKTAVARDLWRDSSLWFAYTQQSWWQLYADSDASAPFRETNHQPEVIWEVPVDFELFGVNARTVPITFTHQSNGRSSPLSRSWNRVTARLLMDRGRWVLSAKTWLRVDPSDNDDNPNIEDFMGRIQLAAAYKGDHSTLFISLKNNLDTDNRSGVEIDWAFPISTHLKGYVQLYSGYDESLIDMETYTSRIGVDLALTDWL